MYCVQATATNSNKGGINLNIMALWIFIYRGSLARDLCVCVCVLPAGLLFILCVYRVSNHILNHVSNQWSRLATRILAVLIWNGNAIFLVLSNILLVSLV